jgi:hypothetical protein
MDNKCLLCDKVKSARKLKAIDDKNLNICGKISEIFNIQLDEIEMTQKFMICEQCIGDLNISYDFCKKVKGAKERLNNSKPSRSNDVMIKLEVKQEAPEHGDDHDDFPFFSPFDNDDDDDDESVKSVKQEKDVIGVDGKKKRGPVRIKIKLIFIKFSKMLK